ncbi:MAG: hypothetical protein K9K37_01435 [Desulfocapsa sp.]|nr:hypothetical protein [Desulfocapsa sp.]
MILPRDYGRINVLKDGTPENHWDFPLFRGRIVVTGIIVIVAYILAMVREVEPGTVLGLKEYHTP